MSSETSLRKHQCIPFLDTNKGASESYTWKRIDKSTIFSLNPNPQTNTLDYICFEAPVTEVDHYEPELPQEIVMNAGNEMYEFIYDQFYGLPVGEEAKVPCLICYPPNAAGEQKAWLVKDTVLQLGEMNTVERKISFTLHLGGDITRGTYTVAAGVPTFEAASASGASGASGTPGATGNP